ncbi:MAG: TrkA family potassium uptake protein [Prolixibacteraceae bacterium]
MKFIVIGLGYFGSTLAVRLTAQGHEVIGIDNRYEKIEEFKDSITMVMEMDTTNEKAVRTLPLDDTDAIIVAIGEDVGSSILTMSILKNLKVNRIIGRIISTVHHNILNQIGITEVVHPEEDTAYTVISMLQLKNAIKVIEIDERNVIAEFYTPKKYVDHTLESMNISKRFKLNLIAVKNRPAKKEGLLSAKAEYKTHFDFDLLIPMKSDDIMLVAGELSNVKRFIND